MPDDETTVADVIRDTHTTADREPLAAVADGAIDQHTLDYEDWVRPMKLTAGRVCLNVQRPSYSSWVSYEKGGELVYTKGTKSKYTVVGPRAISWFKDDLDSGRTITPVLREDTPFGGESDA